MTLLQKSNSEFFNRRVLFVSADKISVYHWEKGELGSSYLFDIDDAGQENFERYLTESENTPMTMLVDVIEEEFRQDTIPHVFGADRAALIERKQSRLFRDAEYICVQNQGREEVGRKDDRLLFIALTRNEVIKPWLGLLEKFKVPVRGIISVPLLLESYIKTLPDISDHALFVTMQSISGLRQTFFQNKQLKLSRLSKLPRYGTESYAPRVETEVEKTQRYLNSLRLVPNDTSLDVYVVADKVMLDELEKRRISAPMLKLNYLDVNKLKKVIQESSDQVVPFSDQLLMSYLLKTQPKNCYATAKDMRYMKMRNMRYAMNAASIGLLLVSIIYSSISFMGGLTYKQESEAAKGKAAFYQARYDLARERLPKTPVEPAQIKLAVDAVSRLEEYKATPYQMMRFVGKALEKYPAIKLDDLTWSFSMDPNRGIEAKENSSPIEPLTTEGNEVKYYQISNFNAHIESFDGNYREAIAMVNDFAKALREDKAAYSVTIESFPLDISSEATLAGSAQATSKKAAFSLRTVIGIN